MGRTRMMPDPENPGVRVEGELVRIESTQEMPSYVTLEDGTEITLRTTVLEIVRIKDRWDAQGNPSYSITVNGTININAPESLRKKEA